MTYKGAFEERTDKSQYSQLKMGNKQTIFTQEQLDAYQVWSKLKGCLDITLNNGKSVVGFFKTTSFKN